MLLVISGPSGAGKGTVVKELVKRGDYALSVSVTTRPPRPAEVNGSDYFFCSEREFSDLKNGGGLIESAEFNGHSYGTPKAFVEEKISEGRIVILEINVAGALQIKQKFGDGVLIFITPPDKRELERRLVKRGTQTAVSIKERLAIADREISSAEKYDYFIINNVVEETVKHIETVAAAERLRPFRNIEVIKNFLV